ncbi:MAG: hypothetical protein HWN68_17480 [Desulfobacterales bacterium]|nr:hypothetical protein [Desulfobacterales bacterium]
MEDNRDLAEIFEAQKTRLEALETKFAEFEQRKPYAAPYGEPFIKAVIELVRKVKGDTKEEIIKALEAMTGEIFIEAKDKKECEEKGGVWDEKLNRCIKTEKTGEFLRHYPQYALPIEKYDTSDAKAEELAKKIMGGVT